MTTKMLIDARHREETRVAVVKGNRIEEFDFESAERKQLKGNIYLAKVTRVEPSLQAAFVDYGGNRHGFLAFSEIHPDYYQIPKEDRDALLREEAEHAAEEAALRESDDDDLDADEAEDAGDDDHRDDETGEEEGGRRPRKRGNGGSDDAVEALRQRRMNLRRRYKIQDVIRRRQILLVQVVKEERGNKGAALTTYLSLAGRYCVLMPNTAHGGGISRKISNAADRKRLKSIMADLKLPPSMGCIVRTAGLQRTKTEIKRDFDYLARLWDEIRDKTLQSSAPALVYGDSDLIKRAIRDIYNRDIDEVIVEGGEGFRHAKDFMKLLMPSHARRVKHYADPVPLFQRHHVEDQLAAMYHPVVQLKSGGYLVINPTEALVSIDINSGRATREHNIEQTATQTNLEAAEEIARQLRLRDMAGLVVIDFIDMDNSSNVRKVEKAMKEALKNDRARIQVGRISSFGLMEMSRQRLRTGVLEASTRQCPHCEGTGLVRTASSAGLSALRLLEDEAARGRGSQLLLRASQEAAFYLLNRKRAELAEIEERYGVTIEVAPDGEREGARMSVEASGPPPVHAPRFEPVLIEADDDEPELDVIEDEDEEEAIEREPREAERGERGERDGSRRKRRRRRGRRGRRGDEFEGGAEGEGDLAEEGAAEDGAGDGEEPREVVAAPVAADQGEDGGRRGRRRRNRRRRGRGGADGASTDLAAETEALGGDEGGADDGEDDADSAASPALIAADAEPIAAAATLPAEAEAAPARKRSRRKKADAPLAEAAVAEAPLADAAPTDPAAPVEVAAKPKRTRRKKAEEPVAEQAAEADAKATEAPAKPKRSRRKKADAEAEAAPEPVALEPVAAAAPADAPAATDEPTPAPELTTASANDAASDDAGANDASANDGGANDAGANDDTGAAPQPRRGWWQRTFGG